MFYAYEFRKDGSADKENGSGERSLLIKRAQNIEDAWRQLAGVLEKSEEQKWVMDNYHFLAKTPVRQQFPCVS